MADTDARFQSLEEYLQNEARITLADRVRNVWYNISENAYNFIPLGAAAAVCGLVAWDWIAFAGHVAATKPYQDAYDFVSALSSAADHVAAIGQHLPVSPETLQVPQRLIEQGIQSGVYADEARQVLARAKGEAPNLAVYLHELKQGLEPLAGSAKENLLALGGVLGSLCGGIGSLFALDYGFSNSYLHDSLEHKKVLRKELPEKLPELREQLETHPFAEKIYDFIDAIKSDVPGYRLLFHLQTLVCYRRAEDVKIFDAITASPRNYLDFNRIERDFDRYVLLTDLGTGRDLPHSATQFR